MSKKDEALKMALEALEHEAEISNDDAYRRERDVIREALAVQPAPAPKVREQQEPVAVVKALPMGHNQTDMHYAECQHLQVGTPLYTSPPQRKPLPAHEIVTMYDESPTGDSDMIAFARAIEAAHGIKGGA